jgi:hypothetical protein
MQLMAQVQISPSKIALASKSIFFTGAGAKVGHSSLLWCYKRGVHNGISVRKLDLNKLIHTGRDCDGNRRL